MIAALLLVAAATGYGGAVVTLRRRSVRWPLRRTIAGAAALACLAIAVEPPLATYDERFAVHVAQHLLLSGVAPLLVVLAAPVTMLIRVLPARRARVLVRALRAWPVRLVTAGPTVLLLQVAGLYLLYLTPLYRLTLEHPLLHDAVHAHMFLAGLLFCWYLAGVDPRPHRAGLPVRLSVLILAAGAHDTLAKLLYARQLPGGAGSAASIRDGAQLLYYGGDAVELALAAAVLTQWYSAGGRRLARASIPLRDAADAAGNRPVSGQILPGEALTDALVEPWGLSGDRRWMLVDEAGEQLTAREHRQLFLATPRFRVDGGLVVTAPDLPPLEVDVPARENGAVMPVRIFGTRVQAASAGGTSDLGDSTAWFTKLLGTSARLVFLDDPTRRTLNPEFGRADDVVSFADGYPLLLTTAESLAQLNELIAAGPRADEGPVPMVRFRPNVVVGGAPAWAEDGWRRLRIGAVEFRAVKGCDRCVMTLLDPDTAASGKEPLATLSRHRRWDRAAWFGMNLIPDVPATPDPRIRVGDPVEVLESVPAGDGPPR